MIGFTIPRGAFLAALQALACAASLAASLALIGLSLAVFAAAALLLATNP